MIKGAIQSKKVKQLLKSKVGLKLVILFPNYYLLSRRIVFR